MPVPQREVPLYRAAALPKALIWNVIARLSFPNLKFVLGLNRLPQSSLLASDFLSDLCFVPYGAEGMDLKMRISFVKKAYYLGGFCS